MAVRQLNLIYALKNGNSVSIEDVESGLKCGCQCPACGEVLVAKKGKKMMHHFAHYSGHNCEYGYETSLHLAAKEMLSQAKYIMLPAAYVTFPNSYKEKELYREATMVSIDRVELEKRFNDVIPDVVIYVNGERIYLEVYVTHAIDDAKLRKIREAIVSVMEIDLSKKQRTITKEELRNIVLGDSEEKTWKYHLDASVMQQHFYSIADQMKIVSRGYAKHVDNCPIKKRVWNGKTYANYVDDCLNCKYCISFQSKGGILCAGRARIARVKDFEMPQSERIRVSDNEIKEEREFRIALGKCPQCGGNLVTRYGVNGEFRGCGNYPHCRFTTSS